MDLARHMAQQERKGELEDEITRLAGDLHAATFRFLSLIGEFDRIGGWSGVGVRSCAHWLTWRCGIGMGAAREKVRVARAIEELPHVADALRLGKLSYSKARAITRIATPDNERYLVDVALSGTSGHLERLVRYARKYGPEAAAERAAHQHEDRFVRTWTDDDGAVVISGRLPPELGAIVVKALDAAVDAARERAFEQASASVDTGEEGLDPAPVAVASFGANRADGLVDLAESFLASGYREGNAGERYQVVVHVAAGVASAATGAAAAAPCNDDGAAPYIEDAAVDADDTARQLACDASVVVMTEREGETVDVGRRTRSVPPAIRRALTHRDGGCVFPGCTCRRFVDAHHIVHWADGGRTALDNLVLLCRHHHRLAHTEGYAFQLKRGRVTITRPDGRHIPRHFALRIPRDGPAAVPRANRERGLDITHRTCTPRWGGEPMDYNLALATLADIHDGRRAPPPVDPRSPAPRCRAEAPLPIRHTATGPGSSAAQHPTAVLCCDL